MNEKTEKRTGLKSFREDAVIKALGLKGNKDSIIGLDAVDAKGNKFEIKTSTKKQVSIARDVYFSHVEKWKKLNWIFAFGKTPNINEFQIEEIYLIKKDNPFLLKKIEEIENKLKEDNSLHLKIISLINQNLHRGHFSPKEIRNLKEFRSNTVRLKKIKFNKSFIVQNGIKLKSPYKDDFEQNF